MWNILYIIKYTRKINSSFMEQSQKFIVAELRLLSSKMLHYVGVVWYLSIKGHCVISQRTIFLIVTAARTSNFHCCVYRSLSVSIWSWAKWIQITLNLIFLIYIIFVIHLRLGLPNYLFAPSFIHIHHLSHACQTCNPSNPPSHHPNCKYR